MLLYEYKLISNINIIVEVAFMAIVREYQIGEVVVQIDDNYIVKAQSEIDEIIKSCGIVWTEALLENGEQPIKPDNRDL